LKLFINEMLAEQPHTNIRTYDNNSRHGHSSHSLYRGYTTRHLLITLRAWCNRIRCPHSLAN